VARAKSVQVRAEDDKRATWLETRELQQNFKDLVYLSLQQVSLIFRFLYFPSLTSRWPFIAVKAVLCDCFVCYMKCFIVSCVLLHHAIFNNSAYSCRHVCLKILYFIASITSSNNYILVFVGLVLKKSRKIIYSFSAVAKCIEAEQTRSKATFTSFRAVDTPTRSCANVSYDLCVLTLFTRNSAFTEGPRDALSVEIMSDAAQLYEESHLKRRAIDALKQPRPVSHAVWAWLTVI